MKIGIIGPETFFQPRKVKDLLFKLHTKFGSELIIYSGGNKTGIEYDVRKYSCEFEINYYEFNPSWTGFNMFSAMPETYYDKPEHFTQYLHRYDLMLRTINAVFIGWQPDDKLWKVYQNVIRSMSKKNIPYTFLI